MSSASETGLSTAEKMLLGVSLKPERRGGGAAAPHAPQAQTERTVRLVAYVPERLKRAVAHHRAESGETASDLVCRLLEEEVSKWQ